MMDFRSDHRLQRGEVWSQISGCAAELSALWDMLVIVIDFSGSEMSFRDDVISHAHFN